MLRMILLIHNSRKGISMFLAFKKAGAGIRKLSPSKIRELIIIAVILIISILLSIPQFKEDCEDLRIWKQAQRSAEAAQQAE